jgi:hypothetical protein
MFALYFIDGVGRREFIATMSGHGLAASMARLISGQDPRDVLVVDNTDTGETILDAVFRKGTRLDQTLTAAIAAAAQLTEQPAGQR